MPHVNGLRGRVFAVSLAVFGHCSRQGLLQGCAIRGWWSPPRRRRWWSTLWQITTNLPLQAVVAISELPAMSMMSREVALGAEQLLAGPVTVGTKQSDIQHDAHVLFTGRVIWSFLLDDDTWNLIALAAKGEGRQAQLGIRLL